MKILVLASLCAAMLTPVPATSDHGANRSAVQLVEEAQQAMAAERYQDALALYDRAASLLPEAALPLRDPPLDSHLFPRRATQHDRCFRSGFQLSCRSESIRSGESPPCRGVLPVQVLVVIPAIEILLGLGRDVHGIEKKCS